MRCLIVAVIVLASAPALADPEVRWQGMVLRGGYAVTPGPIAASGPRLAAGYRVELPRLAFELTTAAEHLTPAGHTGSWTSGEIVGAHAEYTHAFDHLSVRLGGGLGYGTERVWREVSTDNGRWAKPFTERGAHVALRAGIEVGRGPVATIDAGVRLPLFRIAAPKPVYWPTVDVMVGVGVGTTPDHGRRIYPGAVVLADLASAAAALVGVYYVFDALGCACASPPPIDPGVLLVGGPLGFLTIAPALHATWGTRTAFYRSVAYRAASFTLGLVTAGVGWVAGLVAAPLFDYLLAVGHGD